MALEQSGEKAALPSERNCSWFISGQNEQDWFTVRIKKTSIKKGRPIKKGRSEVETLASRDQASGDPEAQHFSPKQHTDTAENTSRSIELSARTHTRTQIKTKNGPKMDFDILVCIKNSIMEIKINNVWSL